MSMNKWWWIGGSAVVVASAAAGAALALRGADVQASPEPSDASPTGPIPAVTAPSPLGPTPEPPVEGALPVPAYPASAIPWDEVGPGWFFLTYDPDTTDNALVDMGVQAYYGDGENWKQPKDDAGMTLISPGGDAYYAGSLVEQGTAYPRLWTGQTLYLFRETKQHYEEDYDGVVTALDLASGMSTKVRSGTGYGPDESTIGGRLVGDHSGDGGLYAMATYRPDGSGARTFAKSGYWCSELAPDEHTMVCLEHRADDRTDVVKYDVDTGTRKAIDVFKRSVWEYQIRGWWSPTSVLFSRWDEESSAQLYFAYNITTKKVTELHPELPDGSTAENVQGLGTYRVVSIWNDRTDYIYDTKGTLRATLPCGAADVSGDYALTLCGQIGTPDTVTVTVVDLLTGETRDVGTYASGIADQVQVFSYRGHSDFYWSDDIIFP